MDLDRFEQEIVINSPVARVWAVLTRPEHLAVWFGNDTPAQVDLRPGGLMVFDHGPHGLLMARIDRMEEPRVFSYRLSQSRTVEEPADGTATLVEFTLTANGDGTRLRVVESGFARLDLPADWVSTRRAQNGANWPGTILRLREYCQRQPA